MPFAMYSLDQVRKGTIKEEGEGDEKGHWKKKGGLSGEDEQTALPMRWFGVTWTAKSGGNKEVGGK